MALFRIEDSISGDILGDYEGDTPDDALDAMARDAGYDDYAAACAVAPAKEGEIVVTLAEAKTA